MANHKSAKKRIRQTKVRTQRNRYYKTKVKNIIRALNEAIVGKDITKARESFNVANKEIHKLVSKGVLKKNTAARKVSRLNKQLKEIAS